MFNLVTNATKLNPIDSIIEMHCLSFEPPALFPENRGEFHTYTCNSVYARWYNVHPIPTMPPG